MKISLVIKNYNTADGKRKFTAAKARGAYLDELQQAMKPSTHVDPSANYRIKFTQYGGVALPTEEGIYDCDIRTGNSDYDDVKAWIDSRPEFVDNPTIRISADRELVSFSKKSDLKPLPNISAKAFRESELDGTDDAPMDNGTLD